MKKKFLYQGSSQNVCPAPAIDNFPTQNKLWGVNCSVAFDYFLPTLFDIFENFPNFFHLDKSKYDIFQHISSFLFSLPLTPLPFKFSLNLIRLNFFPRT